MKKLLSLLGSLSILTTAGNVVVACSNDRIISPKLNPELAKQIIAKLAGTDVASIDFGDLFSSADVTTVVVNIINDLISKQYSYDSTNRLLSQLGLKEYQKTGTNNLLPEEFLQFFNENASTIAEDILFTQYTQSISSGTRMDFTQANSLYALNPIRETTVKSFDGKDEIKVEVQDKIWFNNGNVWAKGSENVDGTKALPQLEDLTKEYGENKAVFSIGSTQEDANTKPISAKTALKLRFQDFFDNKLMKDIIGNLLTTSFIESNMFNISSKGGENANEKAAYLNISNTLFSKTQSWNTSSTADWNSNVKMVWSFKIDNTNQQASAKIRAAFDALNALIDTSTGELLNDSSLIELMNKFKTELGTTPIYTGDNSNAYDSFFGQEGFKGIAIYENGNSLGTSPIASKAYETKVKEADKAGILLNSNLLPYFNDVDNTNIAEVVFVLPIYMIELLGATNVTEEGYTPYAIEGAEGGTDDSVEINFGPTAQSSTRYSDVWNNLNNQEHHSMDVRKLASDEANRQAMINQIKYLVSQDASTSDLAKTVLYSQYLDADEIFYAGLYDQIGRYIKTDEDSDD